MRNRARALWRALGPAAALLALTALLHGQPAHFLDAPFFYPWPGSANFANNHWGDAAP